MRFVVALLAALLCAFPDGCSRAVHKGELRVTRAEQPGPFRSLGKTDVYVRIEGTGGESSSVSLRFPERSARWFLPHTLRLARWDDKTGSFDVVRNTSWDPRREVMTGGVASDGVYTILGLQRSEPLLHAQLDICTYLTMFPVDTIPQKICAEILCPPMDFEGWGDAWAKVDTGLTADSVSAAWGNPCGACLDGPLTAADFPECEIIPDAVIDEGDIVTIESIDTDGDGLLDHVELARGTDPRDKDSDDDGLEDGWEVLGYDYDGNGAADIDLAGMGVDPNRKDILVEVDWMFEDVNGNGVEDAGELSYRPLTAAIDNVVAAFAAGPVPNRNGVTGINLIVNVSNGMPKIDMLGKLATPGPDGAVAFEPAYTRIKDGYVDFAPPGPPRRVPGNMTPGMSGISRYCLWIDVWNTEEWSGIGEWPGPSDDFVVSLGPWYPPGPTLEEQTAVFMHELGHTLGLYHSGSRVPNQPGEDRKYEVHYPSVMNHYHFWGGVEGAWYYAPGPDPPGIEARIANNPPPPYLAASSVSGCVSSGLGCKSEIEGRLCFVPSGCTFTYSSGLLPPVDETNLNELTGIDILPGPIDWNGDGHVDATGVKVDLEGHGLSAEPHTDNNDWMSLMIKFW